MPSMADFETYLRDESIIKESPYSYTNHRNHEIVQIKTSDGQVFDLTLSDESKDDTADQFYGILGHIVYLAREAGYFVIDAE